MSRASPPVTAYVGLGANLADPPAQIRSAIDALRQLPGTTLGRVSSLYRSAPVGYADQPQYINAVAEVHTMLPARTLLESLLEVEARHGRVRPFANAPRLLDLDLLIYGDEVRDEPGLQLPHPRMHERRFVLEPLCEVAPESTIPGRGPARDWLARTAGQQVERLR
ncbi:MAG: 2-amino-4-hydroxy-6-hydroxymethyldihydropteridine diphosphokinase [Betaproteobacteria bacterium RIFCSPLOWO2_02_FULL_65_24]|nr:MAG: 2-amino-4-hydroxy-6-hydroxymethyldihydropteridine diphosphokinase [Betaproteobacteria bacterium RIFCSPLOWO2_02_FULL_65_24]